MIQESRSLRILCWSGSGLTVDGTVTEDLKLIIPLSTNPCYHVGLDRIFQEYRRPTMRETVNKAAEFFLKHRIFKSRRMDQSGPPETFHGKVRRGIHSITQLHYPAYWHYDVLQALIMLDRAGKLDDERIGDGVDLIMSKQNEDGSWSPEDFYWSLKRKGPSKVATSNVEIVDWGRKEPNKFVTLNALRVLKASRGL